MRGSNFHAFPQMDSKLTDRCTDEASLNIVLEATKG